MTKSLVTADDVSQANPRALDDIQQTLDHVNEEIDALEVQFKAQMKVMSALMFEINQTETMNSPTPKSLADLNIKVADLKKLTESYEIIDGMQAMMKTLTATASQLQVMFPGDSGPAKKMLSETLLLQKKVKDRINDAAKFISGLAADKAPKVFDKFTDGIGTLIARCIAYSDVENFLYMFTTKGGQVAFAHYFRLLRAVDENGNDFPELYIVISMLVGTTPTFYMTTLTEMETPSEILFARQVSNLREVARSMHSLLAMDSFQNTIGSTPLPLIIKKEKLTPEMFNSAEHIDRVYVEEELGTLVFRLKPTIKDKDSDLARSIVAQLYTDTLKIVSKFNGKMRPRCVERDGRVEVVFWAQRGAEAPAATADDLEALQVRFKLGDVATKKILRILNRENASTRQTADLVVTPNALLSPSVIAKLRAMYAKVYKNFVEEHYNEDSDDPRNPYGQLLEVLWDYAQLPSTPSNEYEAIYTIMDDMVKPFSKAWNTLLQTVVNPAIAPHSISLLKNDKSPFRPERERLEELKDARKSMYASRKVKAAMTAPVRSVIESLMKTVKGGELDEGDGTVGSWPNAIDFLGVSETILAQVDAQMKKLKFVEGRNKVEHGLIKAYRNKEGTVEVLVHCMNPSGAEILPGVAVHKNAPSTRGLSLVTVDVVNLSMAEPVTAARVTASGPSKTLSDIASALTGIEWDDSLDGYVIHCLTTGALVGMVHTIAKLGIETTYASSGNIVRLKGPNNFSGSLKWSKSTGKAVLTGKGGIIAPAPEPVHSAKKVKSNVYEWQMQVIDLVKKASRSKDWQMGKLRTHDSVSWVCCPTERHLSAEICLDYIVSFLTQQFGRPFYKEDGTGELYKWAMPDATDKGCTNFVAVQTRNSSKGCLTAIFGHTQAGTRRMSSVTASVAKTTEQARIKDNDEYMWRQYTGPGITLNFRGKPLPLDRGEKIGLRLSSNGKSKRMVIERLGLTRVFTLDENLEKQLIPNVKICKAPSMLFASTGKRLTAAGEAARGAYVDNVEDLEAAVKLANAKARKMFDSIKGGLVLSGWSLSYTPGSMDEEACIDFVNSSDSRKSFSLQVIIDGTFMITGRKPNGQTDFSPTIRSVAELNKLVSQKLNS
jgi:hypothetical protein